MALTGPALKRPLYTGPTHRPILSISTESEIAQKLPGAPLTA